MADSLTQGLAQIIEHRGPDATARGLLAGAVVHNIPRADLDCLLVDELPASVAEPLAELVDAVQSLDAAEYATFETKTRAWWNRVA